MIGSELGKYFKNNTLQWEDLWVRLGRILKVTLDVAFPKTFQNL